MANEVMDEDRLAKSLAAVLNMESREGESNTPDFLLAGFLRDVLVAAEKLVKAREDWYGVHHKPGQYNDSYSVRISWEEANRIRRELDKAAPLSPAEGGAVIYQPCSNDFPGENQ